MLIGFHQDRLPAESDVLRSPELSKDNGAGYFVPRIQLSLRPSEVKHYRLLIRVSVPSLLVASNEVRQLQSILKDGLPLILLRNMCACWKRFFVWIIATHQRLLESRVYVLAT